MRFPHQYKMLRLVAVACSLLFGGCEQPSSQLQYVKIGLAEDNFPVILGVELKNTGALPVTVDSCAVQMQSTHLFVANGDDSPWPEKFEHHVELWETPQGRVITPGNSAIVGIALVWDIPPTAPQLIAVCKVSFTIRFDNTSQVETEEVMLVLGSSENARAKILGEPFRNVKEAQALAETFEKFEGKKSANALRVIQLLREISER